MTESREGFTPELWCFDLGLQARMWSPSNPMEPAHSFHADELPEASSFATRQLEVA